MTTKLKEPIYVSGPMSHFPGNNRDAFDDACKRLRSVGYEVCSPHEVNLAVDPKWTEQELWEQFMRADIELLVSCKSVVVLPHWQSSRGAQLEVHIAHALKMAVVPFEIVTVPV